MSDTHKSFDVIGIGGVCWDFLGTVNDFPGRDEKAAMNDFIQQGGGQAATAMVAVARLGGNASIWGRISDDEFGAKNLHQFREEGVDTSHLQVIPGGTSHFAFCAAQPGTGHRTIYWKHGSVGYLQQNDLDTAAVTDCRCLLLDGHHMQASVAAAREARKAGIPVVLDMERPKSDNQVLLELCNYPILPEAYARAHSGINDPIEAACQLHRDLGRLVIVTRGTKGAIAFKDGRMHRQPAFEIETVVDTTGAGDVYHGAFAYGITLDYDLETNMRFAAAVAALKCRALGGRTGIPGFQETWSFINQQQNRETPESTTGSESA